MEEAHGIGFVGVQAKTGYLLHCLIQGEHEALQSNPLQIGEPGLQQQATGKPE